MFLEQQIIILEWFLKDHVTLKTGVMMLKIQLFHHGKKLCNIVTIFHNITVFAVFLINKCSLDELKKTSLKNLTDPEHFMSRKCLLINRSVSPHQFCIMMCSGCFILALVGHYIPGIMISYIICEQTCLFISIYSFYTHCCPFAPATQMHSTQLFKSTSALT